MSLSEMIFSCLGILIVLGILTLVWWKKTRPKYLLSYCEPGKLGSGSYRESEKTRNRYFPWESGVIDLKKHPKYIRFRETWGTKEYLVEPWDRYEKLFVSEGKTKVIVYEHQPTKTGGILLVPCLRTVETIITKDTTDFLTGYKETELGVVSMDNERKIIKSENILGVVKYEGIQN